MITTTRSPILFLRVGEFDHDSGTFPAYLSAKMPDGAIIDLVLINEIQDKVWFQSCIINDPEHKEYFVSHRGQVFESIEM